MRRDDLPILTQVAIAHAHFEATHPFADGNGRTGRALVGALPGNKGVTRKVTIPVSSGLLANTTSYFESLGACQQGDPEPMTEMFAESTFAATENGRLLAAGNNRIQSDIHAALPQKPGNSMRASIRCLVRDPALSAESLMEMTGQSSSSAYSNIAALEAIGALKASSHLKGRKTWIAPAVIEAVDEFALRAGNRTRA